MNTILLLFSRIYITIIIYSNILFLLLFKLLIFNFINISLILLSGCLFNRKSFFIKVIIHFESKFNQFIELLYTKYSITVTNLLVLKVYSDYKFRSAAIDLIILKLLIIKF